MDIPQMTPKEGEKPEETSSPQSANPTSGISTNPPKDPPTEKTQEQLIAEDFQRRDSLAQRQIADQNRKIAELTANVNKLVTEKAKKPTQTPDEAAKEFYKNPRKVIQDVMAETVAPLNAFRESFESDSAYAKLKAQFKADPRYAAYFQRQGFEGLIDSVVEESTKNGVEISPLFIESAITHTIGQVAVGTVQFPDPIAEAAKPEETPAMIPPYLAPSSPPAVRRSAPKNEHRELTEQEDRIRREQDMSVAEWWEWMEMPSTGVIDSKVGIEEKK